MNPVLAWIVGLTLFMAAPVVVLLVVLSRLLP